MAKNDFANFRTDEAGTEALAKTNPNREYKDTMFRTIFKEPRHGVKLFNALTGLDVKEDEIKVVGDPNVLYTGLAKDLTIEASRERVITFTEHQSTPSENMPLRLLRYVATTFERLFMDERIYKNRRIPLDAPICVVLYNGKDDLPGGGDEYVMRLSDAFPEGASFDVEVTVHFIDIRYGRHHRILDEVPELKGYSYFVGQVDVWIENHGARLSDKAALAQAIDFALKATINAGYEFMREYEEEEVVDMMTLEYDQDTAMRVIAEEAREEGMEDANRATAIALHERNTPDDEIASIIHTDILTVKGWLY